MPKFHLAFCLLCLLGLAAPAAASVHAKTSYNYFAISGHTARQIYAALLAHGHVLGDADALASTDVSLAPHPTFVTKPKCRMTSLNVNLTMRINLPRRRNTSALAPEVQQSWGLFAASLKTHEEHHRTLWTACAKRLEQRVLAIGASDCRNFVAKYANALKAGLAQCSADNQAFDATEKIRFLGLPFIRQAAGNW